jgi:hypothetical protein
MVWGLQQILPNMVCVPMTWRNLVLLPFCLADAFKPLVPVYQTVWHHNLRILWSYTSGFGGLGVACCLSVPKFAGSNPAKGVRIFQGEKILSTPSIGGEVKPSVPCCRFAACKRSLNETWKLTFRQNYRPTFSPTIPPFTARISYVVWTWRHLAAKVGMSKNHGGTRVTQ